MIKKITLISLGLILMIGLTLLLKRFLTHQPDYPLKPVNFWQVKVNDHFWTPRMKTNREVTIPYLFRMNEATGRVDNFRIAAGLKKGRHTGKRYNDSDVYKAIEAACYSLKTHPDPHLEKQVDELITLIGLAQEPDGYLFTTRTINPAQPAPGSGPERWSNLRVSHELYNLGHLFEAVYAHYLATGKKSLLKIALNSADLLVKTFGPGQRRGFPGHQEIEIGLVKLYRLTGEKKYLYLARFFLDERGHYYGGQVYPESSPFHIYNSDEYLQNHQPVLEQKEAVGHAVRATYMYCGLLDVGVLGGWPEYARTSARLWQDVVRSKLYLTGGLGVASDYEALGKPYELPNEKAYAETCAAVGNTFWNQRLWQLAGQAQYIDVLERIIYNGLLSGVGLSGDKFFYPNPLASSGNYQRSSWFPVACCPANIARFLATFPQYIYGHTDKAVYLNLFVTSSTTLPLNQTPVRISQETDYPWAGKIKVTLNPVHPVHFGLYLRLPGWARGKPVPSDLYHYLQPLSQPIIVRLNQKKLPLKIEKGYLHLERKWSPGDTIELILPLEPRRVIAHPNVKADRGRVAIEYGPLVYCAEGVDHGGKVTNLLLPDNSPLQAKFQADLLGGVVVISGKALVIETKNQKPKTRELHLIPYCYWANRGANEMAVWLKRLPEKPS